MYEFKNAAGRRVQIFGDVSAIEQHSDAVPGKPGTGTVALYLETGQTIVVAGDLDETVATLSDKKKAQKTTVNE